MFCSIGSGRCQPAERAIAEVEGSVLIVFPCACCCTFAQPPLPCILCFRTPLVALPCCFGPIFIHWVHHVRNSPPPIKAQAREGATRGGAWGSPTGGPGLASMAEWRQGRSGAPAQRTTLPDAAKCDSTRPASASWCPLRGGKEVESPCCAKPCHGVVARRAKRTSLGLPQQLPILSCIASSFVSRRPRLTRRARRTWGRQRVAHSLGRAGSSPPC